MASTKNAYRSAVTSQSKKELIKFAKWMKKNHNKWPTVIGGWAVWSYYPEGFGFRDVDLVLPSENWIKTNMYNNYFKKNNFKPYPYLNQNWIDTHYGKPIDPKKPYFDIVYFDLLSAMEPRADPEELGVYVEWKWANKFGQKIKFDEVYIVVPEIELLVTLKIIGALARTRAYLQVKERSYLAGKIWKDYVDIANLASNLSLVKAKLKKYYLASKLNKLLWQEFLDGYISKQDVLDETKTTVDVITEALKIDWKKQKTKK